MEKVVIINSAVEMKIGHVSNSVIFSDKAESVNKYLNEGWTVKSVNTVGTDGGATAIFVLEKK